MEQPSAVTSSTITPVEFVQANYNQRIADKEVIVLYKNRAIQWIKMYKHDCSLHYDDPMSDYTIVAREIGHYSLCLEVIPYDPAYFRQRCHEALEKMSDDEIYHEFIDTLEWF